MWTLIEVLLLVGLLSGARCAPSVYVRPVNQDCLSPTASQVLYSDSDIIFPSQYYLEGGQVANDSNTVQITVASGFQVQYFPTYKLVTNLLVNETYVLYQCGTPQPSLRGLPAGTKAFAIPLTSVAVTDTVPYAFLGLLGVQDRVELAPTYAVSPCAQKLLTCNRTGVTDVTNATQLAAVAPLVDAITSSAPSNDSKIFVFSASQDPGPLNRAEWVKFLGLFFNLEFFASEYFSQVEARYNDTKALVAADDAHPVVAWITDYEYDDEEFYQISLAPYKVDYTEDAGGQMISAEAIAAIPGVVVDSFSNTTYDFMWTGKGVFPNKSAATAAFHKALSLVDVIIDETYAADPLGYGLAQFYNSYGFTNASADTVPALKAGAVFREDGRLSADNGLDWFEGAIAHPELVLEDMLRAVHPDLAPSQNFTYIRNIDETPVIVTAAACTSIQNCTETPTPLCPLVSVCPNNSTVLLQDGTTCSYEACPTSALRNASAPAPGPAAAPVPAGGKGNGALAASTVPVALAVAAAAAILAL